MYGGESSRAGFQAPSEKIHLQRTEKFILTLPFLPFFSCHHGPDLTLTLKLKSDSTRAFLLLSSIPTYPWVRCVVICFLPSFGQQSTPRIFVFSNFRQNRCCATLVPQKKRKASLCDILSRRRGTALERLDANTHSRKRRYGI